MLLPLPSKGESSGNIDEHDEEEGQKMTPATPVESEQNGIEIYQALRDGRSEAKYFVERTPEEITQELLLDPSTKQVDDEDDEINSLPDDVEDGDLGTDQADSGEGGGKEAARARARAVKVESSDDPDEMPSYWKKGFVLLSREEVETLGLEGGQEAVTEYLDKRCARARVCVCRIVSFKHRPGYEGRQGVTGQFVSITRTVNKYPFDRLCPK